MGRPRSRLANRMPGNLETQGGDAISGEERFSNMKAFVYGEFSAPVTVKMEDLGDRNRADVSRAEARRRLSSGMAFHSSAWSRQSEICIVKFPRGALRR